MMATVRPVGLALLGGAAGFEWSMAKRFNPQILTASSTMRRRQWISQGVFADIAADTGKGIVLTNEGDSLVIALFPDKGNIARDIHMGWADRDAGNRMGESRNAAAAENVLPRSRHGSL